MAHPFIQWFLFGSLVVILLSIDLGVFNRRAHIIGIREAIRLSVFWIFLSLAFNLGIYFWFGTTAAVQFFTGYLVEKSLSVDNLFVFLLIFGYFKVPRELQHTVLFWGILGALLLRGIMIGAGVVLIEQFQWILYIFGAFLIVTGIQMALSKGTTEIHPEKNIVLRLFRLLFPVDAEYHGKKFFIRKEGRISATLLMIVLIVIETTDIVFAVDSIPAIFGITRDPFIVYTSNVFAILGLRALYFALAGLMDLFYYLRYGLAVILAFIGAGMLTQDFLHIHEAIQLTVVFLILTVAIIASVIKRRREVPASK